MQRTQLVICVAASLTVMDFNLAYPDPDEAYRPKAPYPPYFQTSLQHGEVCPLQEHPYPQWEQPYPQQGQPYPEQGQPYPPPYPQEGQTCPPSYYDWKAAEPGYNYQPQLATAANTTIVVASQPAATVTSVPPPAKNNEGIALCAVIFSIVTLLFCGSGVICLACSIPALILSIRAMMTTGPTQNNSAGISIALNVAVIVCSIFIIIGLSVGLPLAVASASVATSSSSYYRYSNRYSYSYYY